VLRGDLFEPVADAGLGAFDGVVFASAPDFNETEFGLPTRSTSYPLAEPTGWTDRDRVS
jgi:hypothetical protein